MDEVKVSNPTPPRVTPEQRAELKRLSEAATPGPWTQHTLMVSQGKHRPGERDDICHCGLGMRADAHESERNAALIAAARNALDALLADLDTAEARIEHLKRLLERAVSHVENSPIEDVRDYVKEIKETL